LKEVSQLKESSSMFIVKEVKWSLNPLVIPINNSEISDIALFLEILISNP